MLTQTEDSGRHRLVAALVIGRSVFLATNSYDKTHPACRDGRFLRGTHAEVAAALQHPYPQHGDIYVARFLRNGRPANAKPCPVCRRVLAQLGIERVFYTGDGDEWESLRLAPERVEGARMRGAKLWARRAPRADVPVLDIGVAT